MMNLRVNVWTLVVSFVLAAWCEAWQNDQADSVKYRVTMTTTLTVPQDDVTQIRVWHALPTPRDWTGSKRKPGATKIKWEPRLGKKKYQSEHNSHHVLFDVDKGIQTGKPFEFQTTFEVISRARNFSPASSSAKWEDYDELKIDEESLNLDQQPGHPVLSKVAADIKAKHPPAQAVEEFCRWVDRTLTYDASMSFADDDISGILEAKRGHCAHYLLVLAQLCTEVGIPARRVAGLNLYTPDGVTDGLQHVREDFTNIHTWGEVYIAGTGWVEVEPAQRNAPFEIPARFVQNNPWFQNYAVWIGIGQQQMQPSWEFRGGRWVSEYKIAHIIQYEELAESETAAPPQPQSRLWKDATGRFQVEATLVSVGDGQVNLKKQDGTIIAVPLAKLSANDRKYLRDREDN